MQVIKLRSMVYAKFESQAEFARRLKWHVNKVNNMLNGKYVPDVDEAAEISRILNMSDNENLDIFLHKISPIGDKHTA